ncbi:SGNH/GDSL hydrolase family protein [Chamaesiphon sp. VAR_48_metabat_135_sub]|uniref:SGNH/GDSL hydrolase family protein n=1 Tax=Chamaesiphon sp. VAR_48_metabat_135_sub TaxID=2964699 RepID=UPI00286CF701|nr:SGNH/GDSL hydrolase family protein [Chamaesiphon sp. VAR_48_metabat_135_sub]
MVKLANSIAGQLLGFVSINCGVLVTQPLIAQPSPPPTASMTAKDPQPQPRKLPKVVFFGSSSTVGFGTTRGDRRWTTLLSRYLGWEEINEGLSGSTVSTALRGKELASVPSGLERWRENVLSRKPDRVAILYGVNDAFRRITIGTPNQRGTYSGDLTKMLTGMAQEFKPHQLIISTSQPNQATLDRRQDYDRVLQATTKQIGGYFIDAGKEAFPLSDLADYSADGLHLNNFGHAIFAAYMANKMVDLGLEPAPPQGQGGNLIQKETQPLPGGFFYIDLHHPLTFGRVRSIETKWVAPGRARIVIVRPDGRGGYEAIYRTSILNVAPGVSRIEVPNWWVLNDDRLAVWTEGNCLGSYELPPNLSGHLAISQGNIIRDIPANRGHLAPQALAIHTIP